MALSEIVNVQITAQTTTVSQPGFGTLMILGLHKRFNELLQYYANMQQVAAVFQPQDPEYIAAQDFFAQPVVPPKMAIGRRTIDTATISVETAMKSFLYTTTINGTPYTATATAGSIAVFSLPFVSGNYIKSSINGTVQGIIKSQLTFSANFVTGNSIVTTVNGTPLAPVSFTTDNDTTIAAVAASIAGAAGVASAVVSGTPPNQHVITVTFTAAGQNTVNSVLTTGGASQPTVAIAEGSIVFTTDHLTTITALAALWATNPSVLSATVGGAGNQTITVVGNLGVNSIVDYAVTTGGVSQPLATITYPVSVVPKLVSLIGSDPTVNVTDNFNGSFTLTSKVAGTPWTLAVSTNIVNPIQARVQIDQTIPQQAYVVTINGNAYTYTAPINVSTSAQVSLGLVTLINADPNATGIYSASDNGNGTFEVQSVNGNAFSIQASLNIMQVLIGLIIAPYTTSTPVTTDLTAINNFDSTWYALSLTDRTQSTVFAAAGWAQSNTKLFGTASSDPNIINQGVGVDVTSIAYQLQNAQYSRTFCLYHQDAGNNQLPGPGLDYPEAAWFGTMLWQDPGSNTWALKQLLTIPYSNLTLTQSLNVRGKYANTYEYIGGVGVTRDGKVSSNQYIDIIIGIDWLTSTIQTNVYSVLVNNPKVPYTDAGITAIQSQIERSLEQAVNQNFLAASPPYQVSVPKAANVPSADKAARTLNNVTFQGTLAGAIQVVQIVGTVSL